MYVICSIRLRIASKEGRKVIHLGRAEVDRLSVGWSVRPELPPAGGHGGEGKAMGLLQPPSELFQLLHIPGCPRWGTR